MGADIGFYIQKKNEGKWENVLLYKANAEVATIWRRGWDIFQELRDNWLKCSNNDYLKEFAKQVDWEIEDDDDIAYWASFAKIKYFAEKYEPYPHDTEEEDEFNIIEFYKRLIKDINAYLNFTDNDWIDIDRIRIVALVSY